MGFGVPVAVMPFGRSAKKRSTGRGTPRGSTNTNIGVDEPIFTDTRGDGICRSKSNVAVVAIDVVVAFDVVVAVVVDVVIEAVVAVVAVVVVTDGRGTAIVAGVVVVAGATTVPSTTLRRLTVDVGTVDFFTEALFVASCFTGFFAVALVIATVRVTAPD